MGALVTKNILRMLWSILLVAAISYWAYGPVEKQTVIECDFVRPLNESAATFSNISKIHTKGAIRDPDQFGMTQYEGTARLIAGQDTAERPISGLLWRGDSGGVEGLFLSFVFEGKSQAELHLATLNSAGRLASDPSTAHLFSAEEPTHDETMQYRCHSYRNYQHIYNRLFSISSLLGFLFAMLFVVLVTMADRRAEEIDYRRR